jgi:ring-1,2-phenylacetyl-CoA epoxidase subunit PaaD
LATIIPTLHPLYSARLSRRQQSSNPELWDMLDSVCDPELPGVTLWDLGVLQDINILNNSIEVGITLTYTGCPAVHTMTQDIKTCLSQHYPDYEINVKVLLSPAWSTDMMSPEAKNQLADIHIVAPDANDHVQCPLCNSAKTTLLSQFGSTACKALYRCDDCQETFDYFKSL